MIQSGRGNFRRKLDQKTKRWVPDFSYPVTQPIGISMLPIQAQGVSEPLQNLGTCPCCHVFVTVHTTLGLPAHRMLLFMLFVNTVILLVK